MAGTTFWIEYQTPIQEAQAQSVAQRPSLADKQQTPNEKGDTIMNGCQVSGGFAS
jgi:hypothetical protein